jgi:putative DNA primase/helicase
MINFSNIQAQIIANISSKQIEHYRRSATTDKGRVAGYGDEISKGVLQSDIRMYKRILYAYNGRYYEVFDKMVFTNMIVNVMMAFKLGVEQHFYYRDKVVDFCTDRLVEKDITPQRHMIPFRNFVVDSTDLSTFPHSPNLDVLYCLDYDYNPDATCPLWLKFLSQVLPEKGLIEVLQEYLGLIFVNRDKYKMEQMLVCLGGGSNGKSVIFETLFRLIGIENMSNFDMTQLTRGQSSEANIAEMDGKILNYCSDLDPKDISGGVIKRLISGEPMQARKMYKDPMLMKNIPLFICNANALPDTSDKSHGWFRRLLIIPFNVTIKEKDQDKQLATKLRSEFAGILNWIMEGRRRIVANELQFTSVKEIERVKEGYKIVQDAIHGFLVTNHLQAEKEGGLQYKVGNLDLYQQYCEYCVDAGKKPYGKNKFLEKLRDLGFMSFRSGTERGVFVYCDRNPSLNWNKDVGLVNDEVDLEDQVPDDILPF